MSWLARREGWNPQSEDAREDGDVDYARVIHSASFRRLQGKTQILNLGDSDFYRTRLTHSLEVAQIAGGIARQLERSFPDHPASSILPDRSTIHSIGCTHDFGHPPFGHGGEIALNYCMREAGGFEGNGQTLRILGRLETFSAGAGANLTRRTLLGVLKYPVAFSLVNNPGLVPALRNGPSTIKVLDCSIMDAADDIAYGVHDLEDAIALDLVTRDSFALAVQDHCPTFLDALKAKYPGESANNVFSQMLDGLFGGAASRKRYVGRLVHHFLTAVEYVEFPEFAEPLLRYRVRVREGERQFLDVLQDFVVREVITSPAVQHLEFKGQGMVIAVFEAMETNPERLLPREELAKFEAAGGDSRVICDYIAAMTDTHLLKTYERLFSPRMGSVFDRL